MVKTIQTAKSFAALLVMVVAMVIAVLPTATVSAAPGKPGYCDADVPQLNNKDFGTQVPVILVHGFNGNATDWGSISDNNSFAGRIDDIPGVAVAHSFDYDFWGYSATINWVDVPRMGPRLAKTIDCVSRISQNNGGKGKVVLVGYSMGGLVARDALSRQSTDGQRAIADQVDHVVTIGTPHAGTTLWPGLQLFPNSLGGAFTPGSPHLSRLPQFPADTTVRTIAGDVTKVYYDFQGRETRREQPHDDTLVTTLSAHAAYTIDVDKGGGDKTVSCEQRYRSGGWFGEPVAQGTANCKHEVLQSNGQVRNHTIDAITKYVAWLNAPPAPESFTVGAITLRFNPTMWDGYGYGASGPNQDALGRDLTFPHACTNCTDTPPPTVYPAVLVMNLTDWCVDGRTALQCASDWAGTPVSEAPAATVGGRTPDSSARFGYPNDAGSRLFWCFEDEKVCIDYVTGANIELGVSPGLQDLFNTATWSN
ncbi:MAG TPA: alpha/beta fold hydrolase [Candidatus Saccharimonadales bacterium]|nr:alpha/beta fold hydrolase [Candidatus Saccharimonadales bacterium]